MKKIKEVEKYFENSNLLISLNQLINKFNLSRSYVYVILRKLINKGVIVKVKGKINYYQKLQK